ncbi:response regulator [Salicibibacter cibarius]|uniref:Response regulator n=1 Tax=Salicibibacter cibarius TaxID=2743000 RepID=A0A7T6Z0P0_9BACI|nr:response regulator [Salicibibacter cibarius]QQK74803.1 response regulator [Salicibibacter cibarius]
MNVIIAEDDYRVSLLHEQFLQPFPQFNVTGKALNGEELKKLLKQAQPQLILLDIYFPDIHGTALLSFIRSNYPHVDVIIISASDNRDDLLKAKRHGVYYYFVKPVTASDFQQVMKRYLRDYEWFQEKAPFQPKDIERLFGHAGNQYPSDKQSELPTGIDVITLEKVKEQLTRAKEGLTIDETCNGVGISRTTARRYLEYLVSISKAEPKLNYGVIGRPERVYVTTED